MQGWIKLHRSIWNNPVVSKDSDHLAVWIYLLTHATHMEYDVNFAGDRITLKPGQLITGRKKLSTTLGINEHKIDRILKLLKSEQQIEQQVSNRGSLITIVNWNKYQVIEQQNEQKLSNKRATSEQQVSTNKNINNINNINNVFNQSIKGQGVDNFDGGYVDNFDGRLEQLRARIKKTNADWRVNHE